MNQEMDWSTYHRIVVCTMAVLLPWCLSVDAIAVEPIVAIDDDPSASKGIAARIGQEIFLDSSLSRPVGQACVSCHSPAVAFADPRPVSAGAVKGRKGTRNAPSLMYAALIPSFAYEDLFTKDGLEIYAYEGGLFHDGRARDLFEQVQQPFFDRNEMNLPDLAELAARLRRSAYAGELKHSVGPQRWNDDSQLTYHAFRALVEFLKDPMFRPFDARIDDFLAGNSDALSDAERRGLEVFRGAGKCADCHLLEPTSWTPPLLSDFGYDNLGVPSRGEKDTGLGAKIGVEGVGQFRAPSLRNVQLTGPYMHNGAIETLQEVMEFYNKRDLEPQRWGPTDFPETVNREDMGNLKLSDQQVKDLVALMAAFTDRSLVARQTGKRFPSSPKHIPATAAKRLFFPDWTHRLHPAFPGVWDELPRSTETPPNQPDGAKSTRPDGAK
jgi:cytochrome c peroxidase